MQTRRETCLQFILSQPAVSLMKREQLKERFLASFFRTNKNSTESFQATGTEEQHLHTLSFRWPSLHDFLYQPVLNSGGMNIKCLQSFADFHCAFMLSGCDSLLSAWGVSPGIFWCKCHRTMSGDLIEIRPWRGLMWWRGDNKYTEESLVCLKPIMNADLIYIKYIDNIV